MNLRPVLFAAAAVVAAFWICLALYRWGARGHGDLGVLTRAFQHGEELESHVKASRRRDEAKRAMATEVVAGRISLCETADLFRRLDEANLSYPPDVPRPPGYERTLYESVLDYVWLVLRDKGQFAAAARCFGEAPRSAGSGWPTGRHVEEDRTGQGQDRSRGRAQSPLSRLVRPRSTTLSYVGERASGSVQM
jgi:hypothetical protein